MKSTRLKILIMVILSNMLITLIIGTVIVLKSSDAFEEIAIKKVVEVTETYALEFDEHLLSVVEAAIEAEIFVESLLDVEKLFTDSTYLDKFEVLISPIIKKIAERGVVTQSSYVFFDPSVDGKIHDVWYSDLDHSGEVIRQDEFPKSFYDNLGPGDEWYIVPYENNKPYWTEPYYGSVEQDAHISYVSHTRPVSINGRVVAVVGSDYHFTAMKETIESFELYNTGYGILVNEVGDVIIHPSIPIGDNIGEYENGAYKWLIDEIIDHHNGIVKYTWIDGEDKFLAYREIENGWHFAITVEEDEVFSWYQHFLSILIGTTVAFTGVIIILSFRLSNHITKPIYELSKYVEGMKTGHYDDVIPDKLTLQKDEIGQLAATIESMRFKLKESLDETTSYFQILEMRVKERSELIQKSQIEIEDALVQNDDQNKELQEINSQLELVFKSLEETQKQLIETEKIASMNSVMTRVAYEFYLPISEFNKLLSALKSEKELIELQLINKELKKQDLTNFFETFDVAYKDIMYQLSYMKDLVERFKALDPDVSKVLLTKFNMSNLLKIIIDSMDIPFNIGVDVICPDSLELKQDAVRISQIVMHLVENSIVHAFKDMDSGMIVIDVDMDEELRISIKDNGCGIANEYLKRIFEPIYAYEMDSGYGLSIVYNMVRKSFGGTIECQSTEGFGTEFIIRLKV
ncbi:MAG: Cache 3/Cache 2 fusion domain-containing protein [Clostridiales bacterium]|nr:Cache 3/Cache 2 fusion domain-containing protein [Clostridiales bacterium]